MEILDQPIENPSEKKFNFDVLPTATAAYSHAINIVKERFVDLLLMGLIVLAVSVLSAVASVLSLFITIPMSYGANYLYLKATRGEEFQVSDVFDGFKQYKDVIISGVLVVMIVSIGTILLIVPGIIAGIRLSFVPYLVMDRKMEGVEAIKESWEMTKGFGFEIFLLGVLAFFIILGGLLLLGVGLIPASMWISTGMATLYQAVDSVKRGDLVKDDELID